MTANPRIFEVTDQMGTAALGAALAAHLPAGTVVARIGTLGAGKTRLVQAVAEASGIDPREVVSPTFVLLHEYQAERPIYHFDVYRLRDDDEFLQLGPDEYFERGGLTFVEWADRVARCLPPEHVQIRIDVTGPNAAPFYDYGQRRPIAKRDRAALKGRCGAALRDCACNGSIGINHWCYWRRHPGC